MVGEMTATLCLEIVEGPGAGLTVPLREPILIGRDQEADLALDSMNVSRWHARVSVGEDGAAIVEDLASSNGTFVDQTEVHGPTRMEVGDELLIGTTLFSLRAGVEVDRRATTVHAAITPALAAPPSPLPPTVPPPPWPPLRPPTASPAATPPSTETTAVPELEQLLDVNVKWGARTAPLAMLALVALIVIVYLGAH